jgi:hypothetical protein
MNARDAIRTALQTSQTIVPRLLEDLSDADILLRPVPGANHIAWQLGHLILSEVSMGSQVPGAAYPELPAGFAQQHDKAMAGQDPPSGFATKATYLDLFGRVRRATLAAVEKMSDADCDRPTQGRMAQFFPTLGALLLLTAMHPTMHSGQFSVVRRKLGKPVVM